VIAVLGHKERRVALNREGYEQLSADSAGPAAALGTGGKVTRLISRAIR